MSRILTLTLALIAAAAILMAGAGCDDESSGSVDPNSSQSPRLISVFPNDGASGVHPGTDMHLTFNTPMDTASVHSAFHFTGGEIMHEWLDSLEHHIDSGGMMGDGHMDGHHLMNMEHMMNWMDSVEIPGHFMWNDSLDSCTISPDSSLMPGTDYMMFFYGEMHDHTGRHHLNIGDLPPDSIMFRFRTAP